MEKSYPKVTLRRGISVRGYLDRNCFEPQSLGSRHLELVKEMQRRGYRHESPLRIIQRFDLSHKVDRAASLRSLLERCEECRARKEGSTQ
jgi:hypothetical protein